MAAKKKTTKKKAPKRETRATSKDVKEAELQALIADINKSLTHEGRVYLGKQHDPVTRIETGILSLDYVTGGGIPRRRLTLIEGQESSAKTLLTKLTVAQVQRKKGRVLWIVGEEFDYEWAETLGIDVDKLVLCEAEFGDTALETGCSLMETGAFDLMVIDSVQSLGTTREGEGGVGQESYGGGGAGQMWGRIMRRCLSAFNGRKADTAIIGISQVRSAIGKFSAHGPPEPEGTGIWALKHWASIRLRTKKGEKILEGKDENKELVRRMFKIQALKNKTAPGERTSSFWFDFRDDVFGVDAADEVMRYGKVFDLIETKGAWHYGYGLKAQGEDAFVVALRENPSVIQELRTDILYAASKEEKG